jgi:excisionase family DNA binding protein
MGTYTIDDLRASKAATLSIAQTTRVLADLDGNQLDERTVLRAAERGQLPSIKVGRRVLIVRERLLAMLDQPAAVSAAVTPAADGDAA